jgi:thiosulfate reductase cytochrome b subunit
MRSMADRLDRTNMTAEISPELSRSIYRHSLLVRLTHWLNVLCLVVLLMSGLQIFNAHPALYWGQASDFAKPIASIGAHEKGGKRVGFTQFFGHEFETTGLLGLSGPATKPQERGFPAWITLPSYQDLATGRRWHFFFAWLFVINGLVYLLSGVLGGHVWRDLIPSRQRLRHLGRSMIEHLRLRFPTGEEAKQYNVLQQLSYLVVIFLVLPMLVLGGLTMSPGLDAAFPELTAVFSGRQSARTVHFIAAWVLVAFVLVHVLMVVLSGVWNNMRSMVTGWYAITLTGEAHER